MEQQIAAFLGKIVLAGGGGALVAFGIFRFLGASWLENQFQKRLEAFRHENAKELEILRAKVDSELNATISSQEKERVILGDTWRAMNIAFGAVSRFVSTAQFVPSIEGLSGDELNEFLAKFEFSPATIKRILSSEERTVELSESLINLQWSEALDALQDFRNQHFTVEVFISDADASEFLEIINLLSEAVRNRKMYIMSGKPDFWQEADRLANEVAKPKIEAFAKALRGKLLVHAQ